MKDYQLYLEKIVNALSRAGISYPAPSFTTYEGMWSYVEGLGSFLEMNAQLQKSGAGVVLMGLEESTTFKTYWNSEFYQEFQERKLLESKISSENEESKFQEDYAESLVTQEAENLTETASSEDHLTEVVTGVATGLGVGRVASSSNGLDMSNVIFSDDDDEDEEDSEYEEEPLIEEGDFNIGEEEEVSNSDLATSGFDMSNVVFSDDEDDDEEDDFVDDDSSDDFYDVDFEEDTSDEDDFEEEEFVDDSSEESLHGVSKEELTGYDFGNVIFSNDEDDEEDSLSDGEEEYEYDEDGFIIDNSEPEEDDEEDDFIEEEDEYEYDEDGFIIDRSEPEEDDDEEEFFEDTSDGYTYDEDGFVVDDDEPIIEDEDDDFEEDEDNFEDNVVPIQPHQVNPPKETVSKPKPVRPKELQETDKILSIFGSLEGKLRKKVKDVKDKSKN
jgi:AAA ATPase containing von willebrand factor type A (VWA)-like domain